MKPKSKEQIKIIGLYGKLKGISALHKKWAIKNVADHYFSFYRSKLVCFKCGHRWTDPKINQDKFMRMAGHEMYQLTTKCPHCKEKLHGTWYTYRGLDISYIGLLDVIDNYQVIRIISMRQYLKRDEPPKYEFNTVVCHFVNEKGKLKTISLKKAGGFMSDPKWDYSSKLEFRNYSSYDRTRSTVPAKYYPQQNIMPVLYRNGFNDNFHSISADILFSKILSEPKAEILLKAGQVDLLKMFVHYGERYEAHWPSLRIAIKNRYYIDHVSDYIDYIKMLKSLGKDVLSPKYLCPKNFKEAHDQIAEKLKRENKKKEKIKLASEFAAYQKEYEKRMSKYFNIDINAGDLHIKPLTDIVQFYDIGEDQRHCLYVGNYFKKANSLIMCAYVGNKPIETIEVDLKGYAVIQSRGQFNKPTELSHQIVELVNNNMHLIRKAS